MDASGQDSLGHADWIRIYGEVVEEVKDELRAKGRGDDFWDATIIYTTVRFIDNDALKVAMEDCLTLKQSFPHLIRGPSTSRCVTRRASRLTPSFPHAQVSIWSATKTLSIHSASIFPPSFGSKSARRSWVSQYLSSSTQARRSATALGPIKTSSMPFCWVPSESDTASRSASTRN